MRKRPCLPLAGKSMRAAALRQPAVAGTARRTAEVILTSATTRATLRTIAPTWTSVRICSLSQASAR